MLQEGERQYFPNRSGVCPTRIRPDSRTHRACLPRTPLSSTGRHGPGHPHLSSGRHRGNGQRHRSRDVRSHFWNSAKTRGVVNARNPQGTSKKVAQWHQNTTWAEPKGPGLGPLCLSSLQDPGEPVPSGLCLSPPDKDIPGSVPVFHSHSSGG